MLKNAIAIALLSIGSVAAHAAGGYAGVTLGGFAGQAAGNTSNSTAGGSQANTGSYGSNGYATMTSKNEGTTYAYAGADIGPNGAGTNTSGGSFSKSTSASDIRGPFANGQTTSSVGNDFAADSKSNFGSIGAGFTASKHFGEF